MCALTGYERDELIAMDPPTFSTTRAAPPLRSGSRGGLAGESIPQFVEYRYKSRGGRLHDIALNVSFTRANGVIDGALVVGYDVTERKEAERERVRLLEQLSRSVEREMRAARIAGTLAKANEILLSALTPDDVIARLVGEASEAAGAEKALVIRVGDQGSYTITHVRNVRDDLVGKAKDAAFFPGFALAAAGRRPLLIADNWVDERLNREFVVPYGLHAFQLLPLIVDSKVTHVLALSYEEAQAFDDEDYRAAERMAAAMSLALRNALLLEAEQAARWQASQQLEFAQVLLDVSAVVTHWTALEPMLEGLADALLRATGHNRVTIGLWDEKRRSMTTVASRGSHPVPLATLGLSEMSAPARRMVKTKRRVLIDYARARDERLRKLAKERQVRFGLAVPVLARGRLVASITVDAPGERKAFSEREIDLIQAVADQAAVAIENARLVEGLRTSEEGARFLAGVVETADVPFAVRKPDGRLVLFNQAFVELVGYSRHELEEGASTLAVGLTPPDWWEFERPLLAEAVAARRPVRYEKEYLCKDGSRLPVEVFTRPVFDEAGEFTQYHSFITDISERKRAEEELQASEAKYRTLFDNMAEEVHFWRLVRDEAGEIVTWRLVSVNPPALRTWGFDSLEQIEGRTTDEILAPAPPITTCLPCRRSCARALPPLTRTTSPTSTSTFASPACRWVSTSSLPAPTSPPSRRANRRPSRRSVAFARPSSRLRSASVTARPTAAGCASTTVSARCSATSAKSCSD